MQIASLFKCTVQLCKPALKTMLDALCALSSNTIRAVHMAKPGVRSACEAPPHRPPICLCIPADS
jgi:hypothetical protein